MGPEEYAAWSRGTGADWRAARIDQSICALESNRAAGRRREARKSRIDRIMREIHTDVTLENAGDREFFRRGDRGEADIRHSGVDGLSNEPGTEAL